MDEKKTPPPPAVGPPMVWITGCTAGVRDDGLVTLTLYSAGSVADFTAVVPVVAFTGIISQSVAQDILTNLDGAVMAAAKAAKKGP
jgi:hypothetical protein